MSKILRSPKMFTAVFAFLFSLSSLPAFAALTGDPAGDMWNISTNPLGLILGPNLRLDYKMADQWTAGVTGSLVHFNVSGVKADGTSVGLGASYNFTQAFQHSWFVEGGVTYSTFKAKYTESSGREDNVNVTNLAIPILGGYHWYWGHFNLKLGLGPTVNFPSTREIKDNNGDVVKTIPGGAVGVAGDASIGWTF